MSTGDSIGKVEIVGAFSVKEREIYLNVWFERVGGRQFGWRVQMERYPYGSG
jgi:hypothetical protein